MVCLQKVLLEKNALLAARFALGFARVFGIVACAYKVGFVWHDPTEESAAGVVVRLI